jgi:hypothetical protein
VSEGAATPNYARRLQFVTFLGTAVGSCLGLLVPVLFAGNFLGLRGAALLPFGIIGSVAGATLAWWYVLRRTPPPRERVGLVLVATCCLFFVTPLLLIFIPFGWLAAGAVGVITLRYLERSGT